MLRCRHIRTLQFPKFLIKLLQILRINAIIWRGSGERLALGCFHRVPLLLQRCRGVALRRSMITVLVLMVGTARVWQKEYHMVDLLITDG